MRKTIAISLALAAALLGLGVPTAMAGGQTIPWGAGCASIPSGGIRTSASCGASLVNGRAIAPPGAPEAVVRVIAAANQINGRPYVWGGGHASFLSKGYDCSGAVSYALHGAGLLETTMVSGQLAYWGDAGAGRWITIYANAEHVFMVVAGLRFDTRDDRPGVRGPRWKMAAPEARILPAFVARHPAGL
ncbi:MAG: C40 family peptidase [Solirubrobacterales bacterium]|nr:C40 family peptidase [Solirubrobacterales bacterium]